MNSAGFESEIERLALEAAAARARLAELRARLSDLRAMIEATQATDVTPLFQNAQEEAKAG
jgi:hypothetical protein